MYTDIQNVNIINHPLTVPKFHGHMKIELHGSRETKVIEHDNNMTEALETILGSYGLWSNPYNLIEKLCPTVQKAFGSILLTDKTLNDLTIPGGTDVVACASYNISNSDTALTQGSYNETESVLDLPGKKMTYVYDWTTNQGNGVIAAAALSHVNAGKCAYGDAGLTSYESNGFYDICNNQISAPKNTQMILAKKDYEIYAKIDNGKLICYKTEGIMKKVLPITISCTDYSNKINYMKYTVHEFGDVDFNFDNIKAAYTDNDYVYIIKGASYNVDAIIKLYRLNTIDMSLDVIEIKNTSGDKINTTYGYEIYNDYIYFETYNYKIAEININNNEDASIYETGLTSNFYINRIANIHNGKIFVVNNRYVYVFDTITKTFKPTKVRADSTYYLRAAGLMQIYDSGSNQSYCSIGYPHIYLATINNLSEPVTKTADKTMKITYTIQE